MWLKEDDVVHQIGKRVRVAMAESAIYSILFYTLTLLYWSVTVLLAHFVCVGILD